MNFIISCLIFFCFISPIFAEAGNITQNVDSYKKFYEEKAQKKEHQAKWIERLAIGLKSGAFIAELGGYQILALPGLYLALMTAGGAYSVEQSAEKSKEVTERFIAAVKALENSDPLILGDDLPLDQILSSSSKRSCKKSCRSNMGKKNANNIREITWCVLNCPNIILRDYMCEVFANSREKRPDSNNNWKIYKSRDQSTDYLWGEALFEKLAQLFSNGFVKTYRENLRGRMLNRYFQGEFSLSLVGKMSRFTTVAHKMEHSDFWSPDSDPDLKTLVDSLRSNSPMITDIKSCFGTLCYTTKREYAYEIKNSLTKDYYKKFDILRQAIGLKDVPQSGIISLKELQNEPSSPPPPFPAPFANYCSYYFSRTPVNFHSRVRNLPGLEFYKTYFNRKVQERYDLIAKANQNVERFIKLFNSSQGDGRDIKEQAAQLEQFMNNFSEFSVILKTGNSNEIENWKKQNSDKYNQIKEALKPEDIS